MGLRDLFVLLFTLGCIGLSMRKAWYGVLVLAIFSYLNPHAYAWGFVRTFPLYQILFIVVAAMTFLSKERQRIPNDWRIPAFYLLWFYFLITTTQAYLPEIAWQRFWFVSKIYLPFIFTLILINSREKLFYLIITIATSIGIVAVKGGIFAAFSGFSYRVYGPPTTQFYENNAFAIAVLIAIPLLVLWYKETKHKYIKYGIFFAVPLCYMSAISSWSRGALITMAVVTIVLLWHSKRKYFFIPVFLICAFYSTQFLPDEWFGRMATLETYEEDSSAMGRIEAWKDGWYHTLSHPFVGAGFEGWRVVTRRDWHNSSVEMFSEHGFVAYGIWISLILGTIVSLTRLPRMVRGTPGMEWVANYSYMLRASLIAYFVGTTFLGLSYWDILYHLIFISVLLKKFALEEYESIMQQQRTSRPEKRNPLHGPSSEPRRQPMLKTRDGAWE